MVEESRKDQVTPKERLDLDRHVSKVTSALEKPSSVLLFAVVIVIVVVAGNFFADQRQAELLNSWLNSIEEHRAEEVMSCQTTLRQVLGHIGQRIDNEAYARGKSE